MHTQRHKPADRKPADFRQERFNIQNLTSECNLDLLGYILERYPSLSTSTKSVEKSCLRIFPLIHPSQPVLAQHYTNWKQSYTTPAHSLRQSCLRHLSPWSRQPITRNVWRGTADVHKENRPRPLNNSLHWDHNRLQLSKRPNPGGIFWTKLVFAEACGGQMFGEFLENCIFCQ